ncbi:MULTISPECIES: helix-turn-helix domain-containing protein [unclassified Streptosporangium]|uniref:helix-turn-helix domain-containing protein n=1 Tax=unclassified Streptosporangium TaxID=2632669 RepID=UPI002E2C0064|nr:MULTISPECIES: helix-turn-helix domain-containing protein [unclassified Streptosporangium]
MSDWKTTKGVESVTALKAFAHPLRIRLYYALRNARAATVSYLANSVEIPIAQASYHLRQLSRHGFIEPAPQYARDARERWWQLSSQRLRWDASTFLDEPEATSVATMIKNSTVREQYRLIQEFNENNEWDIGWLDAAYMVDAAVDLTRAEVAEMHKELMAVVERYTALSRLRAAGQPMPPEVERVMVIMHGFPVQRPDSTAEKGDGSASDSWAGNSPTGDKTAGGRS